MDKKFWSVSTGTSRMRFSVICKTLISSLILGWLPQILFAADPALTTVLVVPAANYTRLLFKINTATKYHVFLLPNPVRLVVDFDKLHLHANLKNLPLQNSPLRSARSGWPAPGVLRIVFDTNTPVHYKSFFVNDSRNPQLVIDVFTNEKAYLSEIEPAAAVIARPRVISVNHTSARAVATASISEPAIAKPSQILADMQANETPHIIPTVHKISSATDFDISEFKKNPRPQALEIIKPHPLIIVIDAGHGGKDPGTIGTHGTREKDVVLSIAQRLAELINQDPKLHARLTRDGDYFVPLKDRLRLARKDKADLFVAIHADSYFNDQSTGASVYALSQHGASSMAARWLADRENHSELGGVDLNGLGDHSYLLRSVLIDLAQTATIVDSVNLGTDTLTSLESVTSLHYAHVEQAPFMVLKSPDIPSILVEVGFLSNQYEEQRLRDAGYRDKLANALLGGIHQYVAMHPMMASNVKLENNNIITGRA
jgi:N-acetylmuramoyl-L-alanine amidase